MDGLMMVNDSLPKSSKAGCFAGRSAVLQRAPRCSDKDLTRGKVNVYCSWQTAAFYQQKLRDLRTMLQCS